MTKNENTKKKPIAKPEIKPEKKPESPKLVNPHKYLRIVTEGLKPKKDDIILEDLKEKKPKK